MFIILVDTSSGVTIAPKVIIITDGNPTESNLQAGPDAPDLNLSGEVWTT